METYYGTKKIKATPMGCGAYFSSTNRDVPADMDPDQAGYMVEYPGDGYQSWSPDYAFEAAYRKSGEMNFGHALEALKEGLRVCRTGWNGKGMWLELQKPDAHSKMTLPYIFMLTADNNFVPWLASQTDVLADDWMIVEPTGF